MKSKAYIKKIVIGVIVIMGILGLKVSHMLKDINEEKYVSVKEIDEIQVEMYSRKVHFIEMKESCDMKIHVNGRAMQEIKIVCEIDNKTLIIKTYPKPKMPLYENVVLDIYIPKEFEKNLSINTNSSFVKMDSLSLESIIYNTFSGKLEAEQLNAQKVSLNTSSGEIAIKKIDAKEMVIKGKTSAVNIGECNVNEANVETTAGSITLKNSSGTLDVNSGSGKVLISYHKFENQDVKIENSSGSVTLELPNTAEFLVDAKTDTGKIQSDFPITKENTDKKQLVGQIGTKSNKVFLQTTAGSIKILKK